MTTPPQLIITCLDLEGVLIPEIWLGLADRTGLSDLQLTTRDIADYDELMQHRLRVCEQHGLGLPDIQQVVQGMAPLEGAREFLDWLQTRGEVVILSDTFREFVTPLLPQLGHPTIFCHSLEVDSAGKITNYRLRLQDQKRKAVEAFRSLNFQVVAAGDSYNDVSMLQAAHHGILFRPAERVVREFPQFPVTQSYAELKTRLQGLPGYA
jgi:phosphoserine/homoserine phosphotransferase